MVCMKKFAAPQAKKGVAMLYRSAPLEGTGTLCTCAPQRGRAICGRIHDLERLLAGQANSSTAQGSRWSAAHARTQLLLCAHDFTCQCQGGLLTRMVAWAWECDGAAWGREKKGKRAWPLEAEQCRPYVRVHQGVHPDCSVSSILFLRFLTRSLSATRSASGIRATYAIYTERQEHPSVYLVARQQWPATRTSWIT